MPDLEYPEILKLGMVRSDLEPGVVVSNLEPGVVVSNLEPGVVVSNLEPGVDVPGSKPPSVVDACGAALLQESAKTKTKSFIAELFLCA